MTPFSIVDNHHYNLHLSMHLHAKIVTPFENQMMTSLSLNVSMSLVISMGHTEIGNGPIWHPLVLYETRVMSRMTKRATSRDSATGVSKLPSDLMSQTMQLIGFMAHVLWPLGKENRYSMGFDPAVPAGNLGLISDDSATKLLGDLATDAATTTDALGDADRVPPSLAANFKRRFNDGTISKVIDVADYFEERRLVLLKNSFNENLQL